jgi:transposase InsO family protein
MGTKSRDWESIGNYVSQIKDEGLTYVEGAKRFGLNVSDIYEYNKRFKNQSSSESESESESEGSCRGIGKVKDWKKIGEYASRIHELGLKYVDGAKEFGLDVSEIYRYNSRMKEKKEQASAEMNVVDVGDVGTVCVDVESADELNNVNAPASISLPESKGFPPSTRTVTVDAGADVEFGSLGLPSEVEKLIVNYRRENPYHGYKRIEDDLKNHYFVVVSRKKIREVLKFHGLIESVDSSFDKDCVNGNVGKVKGLRRFEASYPRELYQMDITYVYLVNNAIYYLVIIIDDYSRFCVASELRRDQRGLSMIEVLHRAIERYGKPTKLLTDQGSSFYSWSPEQTLFARYLDDMKIEHIVADPHSPQTLGKVERLNQTVQRELLNKSHFSGYEEAYRSIETYFRCYNYERPHQGISGAVPASRFQGIIGETCRIESDLCGHGLDFSRGYLVFKIPEHTISIVCSGGGLQVFLDGHLLKYSQKGASHEDN